MAKLRKKWGKEEEVMNLGEEEQEWMDSLVESIKGS